MSVTYDAGIATSYAAAVAGGYTGTKEQYYAEQAQFAINAQRVAQDRAAVEQITTTFNTVTAPKAIQDVTDEGNTQVQIVKNAGDEYLEDIDSRIDDAVADLKVALEVLQPAATSADVGKALIAKTVENGKVTEYEYGEAGAPPIKDTASGVIASFPDGADNVPMDGVVVTMEPVQDLHGYDNPWPAGGGKNLYSKAIGDDAWHSFNGGSTTNDNGTLTVNMTSTLYSGCYSESASTIRAFTSLIGTYSYSVEVKSSVATDIFIGYQQVGNKKVSCTTNWQTVTFNGISFNGTDMSFNIYNGTTTACTCYLRNFQFESGSTCTDYAPYSNICPISGRTGVTVTRTGKNLAQLEQGTINVSNGVEEASTTRVRTGFIAVETNVTYSTSSQNNGWSIRNGVGYDANKEYIGNGFYPSPDTGRLTVTDSRVAYVRLIYSHTNTSETCVPSDYWYQFEKGSTATTYEPYVSTTIPVTFPTEAGTVYGGTMDVVRGDGVNTRFCKTFNGTESWRRWQDCSDGSWFVYDLSNSERAAQVAFENNVSSHFAAINPNAAGTSTPVGKFAVSATWIGVAVAFSTVDEFKAWLSAQNTAGTPLQVSYVRNTAETFTVDPNTLTSLYGQNNVWSDADSVSAEYTSDTKMYISKVIAAAVAALA